MSDKRLYGIDLFKALAMFLVVVLHVNTLGTAFDSSAPGSAQWWLTDGMMTAAYCCVDCFALATGFLMAERAFRPGRIVSLWLQVAFYAVVTTVVWYFAVPGAVGIKDIVSAFFPVLTSKYWYFSAYFVLFFFMPFINAMLHALDGRARAALLAAVFVFLSLLPTFRPLGVIPLSAGYCFFWLAALYIIGACIKLDRLYERASGKTFVLLYFASIAVMLLCSVALLCAFCRLQVGESFKGAAKFLSSTSFGVYLIHISPFILANYIADSFAFIAGLNAALVIPCELGCAAAIYAVCTLIEFLRQKLFALCGIDRLADIVGRRLDRAAARQ